MAAFIQKPTHTSTISGGHKHGNLFDCNRALSVSRVPHEPAVPVPADGLRTPNKTEKRSKRQQGRKKPNGYQPCVHIGRAGACIDGTRQRFAQQPSGAFQDERNCPPHVWQCGALYVSLCTPVCKTENRTLYQREVSEDDKWVSRANFAGTADDPAYIPAFCNHSHWRQ